MRYPQCGLRGLLIFLLLFSSQSLWSQSQMTTGTIEGTVVDETGAVVSGAAVTLRHVSTGAIRTLGTDTSGRYTAPLLQVGDYEVSVQLTGFTTVKRTGITLNLGQTQTIDVTLKLAAVETTLEVSAAAPLIETSRSEASTTIDLSQVSGLPTNGRRFFDLAFLTPGVAQERERNGLSFAGSRGINSNINIDGADFNQPFFGGQRGGERSDKIYVVSQEAIREFQVVRSNFAAEFGRSTGGVVNVLTKSGTNDWHGSAFYYLRHREFAPRDLSGVDRAPIRQQFGAGVGGPIVKNKTFFYTVYDQQEERQPLIVRFGTTAGVPANLVSQQGTFQTTNDVNTYLVKIDHELSAKHRLNGRYNYSRNKGLNGTNLGVSGVTQSTIENNGTEGDRTHTGVVSLYSVLSPTLLNELRWQYSYEIRPRFNNGETSDFTSKVGPQILITGCCSLGGVPFLPIQQYDDRWQVTDNLSVVKGAHNLKIGFDYNRSFVDQIFRGNWRGDYRFNSVANYLRALNKEINPATNQPYTADQFRLFYGPGSFKASISEYATYVQDTIKLSSKFTLNLGLRHEAFIMPQPIQPNPLLPQTASIPSDKNMWQPRVGLTWDPQGNGKTVLRLGGGFFFGRTPLLLVNQPFTSNGFANVSFTLNPAQIAAVQSVHPEFVFPFVPDTSKVEDAVYITGGGISVRPDASFFAPDFHNPRSLQYTASLEQEFFNHYAVSVDYVHNNTVYLERIHDLNLAPPVFSLDNSTPPVSRPRFTAARPNANFNILRQQESSARSNYDALTLTVKRRLASRLQFFTNYTLAYNRDDDSNERNFAGITYENAYDFRNEYRWSRSDIRHRWVLSGIYELPLGLQLGSIVEWRTGTPFSAFTGVDSNLDGQFSDKPVLSGAPLLRNSFRQPNSFKQDLRVTKNFKISEEHNLALIFEMFNIWNTDNLSYDVNINEQGSSTSLGSLWGQGQTPVSTFRTLRFPDGTLNTRGISFGLPFQLQVAAKYTF